MYDNTNFPRPNYLKEVESRVDNLVRHAQTSRETAPESSMNSARKAAEAICICTLMKHGLPKNGKLPFELDPMLNLLRQNEHAMPYYIRLHAETLQKWGNTPSHFNITPLPAEEIKGAMEELHLLVDWFYKDNGLTRKPTPEVKFKPAEPEIKPAEPAAKTEPAKKPAEDSVEVPRCKANNAFEVWVELSGNRGALIFYSPLSRTNHDPAYVDLESKKFFDLDALVDSIKSIYCHLMRCDEAYTLIHYEKPGRWQACAPWSAIHEDVSKFQIPFTVETAELADNMDLDFLYSPEGPYFDAFELELNSHCLTLTFLKDGQPVQPAGGRIALELSCNSGKTSPDDTIVFSRLHEAAEHLIVHTHPGQWIETELAFTPNDQPFPRFLRDHFGYTEICDDYVSSYSLRYEMIPMTEEEVLHPRETMNDLYRARSRLSTDLLDTQLERDRTQLELNGSERKLKWKSRLIVAACIASILTLHSMCWFPGNILLELLVGIYHFVLVLVMVIHWWRS